MKKKYVVLITAAVIAVLTVLGLIITYFAITASAKLDMSLLEEPKKTVFLDADGGKISGGGNYAKIGEISPNIVKAFVAIEDTRFYKHKGVDPYRMLGAAVKNAAKFKAAEGASTITQQLIKNTHLSNEKSLARKLKEIKLARQLEKKLNKEQIMEKYLNVIYFGNGFYGIDEAARGYFGKSPYEVNVSEAAMLAGIVKSPNKLNPIASEDESLERMNTVLGAMVKNGFISEQVKNAANNYRYKPNFGYNQNNFSQSYTKIAKYQANKILESFGLNAKRDSLVIETYMDSELQKNCYSRLSGVLHTLSGASGTLAVTNNGGARLAAYASSEGYPYSRQAGSVMKPFSVYAPALELNYITPATQILDEETDFSGYKPKNYGGATHGYVSVRDSVKHSYNIPAVKILNDIGLDSVMPFLDAMNIGITDEQKNLSLALGANSVTPLELSGCYAMLANGGYFMPVSALRSIKTESGKILYRDDRMPKRVFREDTAFLMTDMLRSAALDGTAQKLKYLNIDIAAKTGTVGAQNGNSDAYTAAITSEHTFVAWFGGKDKPLDVSVTGGAQPTIAIKSVIENMKDYNPPQFSAPDSVVSVPIDADELKLKHEAIYSPTGTPEYFSRFNAPPHPESDKPHKVLPDFIDKILRFFR